MSIYREMLAEVLWDAAESDSSMPVSWAELVAKAATKALDYQEIEAIYYRQADAVLGLLAGEVEWGTRWAGFTDNRGFFPASDRAAAEEVAEDFPDTVAVQRTAYTTPWIGVQE